MAAEDWAEVVLPSKNRVEVTWRGRERHPDVRQRHPLLGRNRRRVVDLPTCFGKPNSRWQRYSRWRRQGVWQEIAAALRDDDTEWLGVDSSCISANVAAAGAKKKGDGSGGPEAEALDRGCGGNGSKIHCAVNPLGHPVRIKLRPYPTRPRAS